MADRPIVLLHGYSDSGESYAPWIAWLRQRGYHESEIHTVTYRTLTNEVTIKDIAEGFDRALRIEPGLRDGEEFDAIVHSTGMLVIRAWLTAYGRTNQRRSRLKHLIGLAPASFGSPLAHKGRSWLGAIIKGNKEVGSEFLNAGDRVLDGLELGSRFIWDLAHADLLGAQPFYGPDAATPYVFICCGGEAYDGIRQLANEHGTDGTVRWAGCALNTVKITLDLTRNPDLKDRVGVTRSRNEDIPVCLVSGLNHGTILTEPTPEVLALVDAALKVEGQDAFRNWTQDAYQRTDRVSAHIGQWQQFVVRAVDERGDPIIDYNMQLVARGDGGLGEIGAFDVDVHPYSNDPSLRAFHVDLTSAKVNDLKHLWLRVTVASGSMRVGYTGYVDQTLQGDGVADEAIPWDAELDLSKLLAGDGPDGKGTTFFYPFTTTLVELQLNREPSPYDEGAINDLCQFIRVG